MKGKTIKVFVSKAVQSLNYCMATLETKYYSFWSETLDQYCNYMVYNKIKPDWNWLYANLTDEELRLFEKAYYLAQRGKLRTAMSPFYYREVSKEFEIIPELPK